MKKVYMLYSCDAWHSHASRELLKIFFTRGKLDKYIHKMRRKFCLSDYDIEMLKSQDQTQGRDTNYLISTEALS